MIVANIGVDPGFSAIYTTNAAMHTAFVQVNLKAGHQTGSYEYIDRLKKRLDRDMPELSTFFSSGSLVDAVLNMGMQAPIDVQIAGTDQQAGYQLALDMASKIRRLPNVADVFIPQDLDYPALRLDIDRVRAGELGLSEKEVVGNVITALTSNQMIAPNVWIDPRNNNNYFLNVQYAEGAIRSLADVRAIPLRGPKLTQPTRLDMVSRISAIQAPTEVDHYQIRRTLDIWVRPHSEDLGRVADGVADVIGQHQAAEGHRGHRPRLGRRHAAIAPQLWPRTFTLGAAAVSRACRAVPLVRRPGARPAGVPAGNFRSAADTVAVGNAAQRHVAHGSCHACRRHDV